MITSAYTNICNKKGSGLKKVAFHEIVRGGIMGLGLGGGRMAFLTDAEKEALQQERGLSTEGELVRRGMGYGLIGGVAGTGVGRSLSVAHDIVKGMSLGGPRKTKATILGMLGSIGGAALTTRNFSSGHAQDIIRKRVLSEKEQG